VKGGVAGAAISEFAACFAGTERALRTMPSAKAEAIAGMHIFPAMKEIVLFVFRSMLIFKRVADVQFRTPLFACGQPARPTLVEFQQIA
jgi:hypothetical protein